MKETGLMFKAPLVRSILDGSKMQTRRIFKVPASCSWYEGLGGEAKGWLQDDDGPSWWHIDEQRCPFGQPGDRIYVRETFAPFERNCFYRADGDHADLRPWKPAIHMPKALARIWLEITGVRVERLQDISEADCIAEGISELPHQAAERGCWWTGNVAAGAALHGRTPRNAFQLLWESTGGDWAASPWVWVIDFKRIHNRQATP